MAYGVICVLVKVCCNIEIILCLVVGIKAICTIFHSFEGTVAWYCVTKSSCLFDIFVLNVNDTVFLNRGLSYQYGYNIERHMVYLIYPGHHIVTGWEVNISPCEL